MTPSPLRRDVTVIALVGSAHFFSHFFQLSVAPLFPLIKREFGTSYAALGLMASVFYGASGLAQTPAGFLVDRFGARRVLFGGLTLLAVAVGLAGLAPTYWALLPLAALAGLGNSVFHPADYAILTGRVSELRIGRAYSMHALAGNLGWATAPVVVVSLATLWGWRTALIGAGLIGLAAVLALARNREALADAHPGHPSRTPAGTTAPRSIEVLLSPGILACFGYFALLSFALIGVQTFSPTALVTIYDVPLGTATGALTAFLLASGAGILVGGRLADFTLRHDLVAMLGMSAAALLMLAVASGTLPLPLLIGAIPLAGFSSGVTSPSRDMLVRAATPRGSSGKVFGFVYSGLDLGSSTGPLLFGFLLDHGQPQAVFVVIAGLMLLTTLTVVQVRLRAVARPVTY